MEKTITFEQEIREGKIKEKYSKSVQYYVKKIKNSLKNEWVLKEKGMNKKYDEFMEDISEKEKKKLRKKIPIFRYFCVHFSKEEELHMYPFVSEKYLINAEILQKVFFQSQIECLMVRKKNKDRPGYAFSVKEFGNEKHIYIIKL